METDFERIVVREVVLVDDSGKQRLILSARGKDGWPTIQLSDARSLQRLVLFVQNDGRAALSFLNAEGQLRFTVASDQSGEVGVVYYDDRGESRLLVGVDANGQLVSGVPESGA
jgi:hypothetical protein